MRLRALPYKWIVAAVFILGLFMDLLDSTITTVAVPSLTRELHTTTSTIVWVVIGYLLSLAMWVPASGWIGDKIGTKKCFVTALCLFTVCSVLCGLAWNPGSLILFRVLQGIGGGILVPVATAMLFRAFPRDERVLASAVLAVPTLVAPAVGPILGGWLVTDFSWRWIFFINVPVGLLGLVCAELFIAEEKQATAGRFDLVGFIGSGTGLALVLYGLSRGAADGWAAANVAGTLVAGVIVCSAVAVWEFRHEEPILALELFGERMYRSGTLFMYVAVGSMLGLLFLMPIFLQELRGLSPLQSGLTTFPEAVGTLLAVPVASWLYPRVGPKRMMLAGSAGLAVTTGVFFFVDLDTSLWCIGLIMFVRGIALAGAMVPVEVAARTAITPADAGRASSLFNANKRIASSVSVAIVATVLTDRTIVHVHHTAQTAAAAARGSLLAFHETFLIGALLCLLGVAFALRISDADAAAWISEDNASMPSA